MSFEGLGLTGLSNYPDIPALITGYSFVAGNDFYTVDGSDVGNTGLTDIKGSSLDIGDSFGVTGTDAVEYIPYPTSDLESALNVVDFKITSTGVTPISSPYTEITLNYKGIANLEDSGITGVILTAYEYSINNGTSWHTMTTTSPTTDLIFGVTGSVHTLIWDIKEDIDSIYNISIKVRLKAQATFESTSLLTDYATIPVFIPKNIVVSTPAPTPVFPQEYSGTVGSSLLKNAPKPEK